MLEIYLLIKLYNLFYNRLIYTINKILDHKLKKNTLFYVF